MFPRFRKEDPSQSSKEQSHGAPSPSEKTVEKNDAASTRGGLPASYHGNGALGLPDLGSSKLDDASTASVLLPTQSQRDDAPAEIVDIQAPASAADQDERDSTYDNDIHGGPHKHLRSGDAADQTRQEESSDPRPLDVTIEGTVDTQSTTRGGNDEGVAPLPSDVLDASEATERPRLMAPPRTKGRRLAIPNGRGPRQEFTPQQRLLLLDTWQRSGLPAADFAPLIGVGRQTLYAWKKRFDEHGPAGLEDQPRGGKKGSRLPELTKRTILMLKESHPEWGCQRISDMLARGPALPASASTVARVLHEAGYESVEQPTRAHAEKVQRFQRAKPNQLWQTDLFTFVLKRQNRRVYLVAFLDDHSRFLVSYGLHASQSTALVLEVLEAGIANYGPPEEILTDNGPQYVTWRGKSQFTKRLEKRGIRQIVSKPKHPQTLGKIERFWGTLWRECIETAVFLDLGDARRRIGLFIDSYNFQRVHQGIDGLVPADRFFHAAPEVLKTLKDRVAANALELARHGVPKSPFYLTGQLDGEPFSVHREGDRVMLRRGAQPPEEIDLPGSGQSSPHDRTGCEKQSADTLPPTVCPDGSPQAISGEPGNQPPPPPGVSSLDQANPLANEANPSRGQTANGSQGQEVTGDE